MIMVIANTRVDFKFIDRATPKLKKLTPMLQKRIGKALFDAATYAQERANFYIYEYAPPGQKSPPGFYAKGKLGSSLRFSLNVNTRGGRAWLRATAPHAAVVEFGRKNGSVMHGKFYMKQAARDTAVRFPKLVSDGVRLGIREAGFRTFK